MIGREELERKAFRLIKEAGDGLLQSEMRKILGVGSSEASSIALKFLERRVFLFASLGLGFLLSVGALVGILKYRDLQRRLMEGRRARSDAEAQEDVTEG